MQAQQHARIPLVAMLQAAQGRFELCLASLVHPTNLNAGKCILNVSALSHTSRWLSHHTSPTCSSPSYPCIAASSLLHLACPGLSHSCSTGCQQLLRESNTGAPAPPVQSISTPLPRAATASCAASPLPHRAAWQGQQAVARQGGEGAGRAASCRPVRWPARLCLHRPSPPRARQGWPHGQPAVPTAA